MVGPDSRSVDPDHPGLDLSGAIHGKMLVISVGVDGHADATIPKTQSGESDARRLAATLGTVGLKGYSSVEKLVLCGSAATRSAILGAITDAGRRLDPEDTLVFAYEGNGVVGDKPSSGNLLIPYDAQLGKPASMISLWTLKAALSGSAARNQVVILDTCHGGDQVDGFPLERFFAPSADGFATTNLLFLGVSGPAFETSEGGLLTSAIIDTLQDSNSDLDGNGVISADEVLSAIRTRLHNSKEVLAWLRSGANFPVELAPRKSGGERPPLTLHHRGVALQGPTKSNGATGQGTEAPKDWAGHNYALLIATDDYKSYAHLNNPIADAKGLKATLESVYGFEVKLLPNPSKDDVWRAINEYRTNQGKGGKYKPDDQLLVFFSGHGLYDADAKNGYLLFKDSLPTENDISHSSSLSYTDLAKLVDTLPFVHICLILDACFSGKISECLSGVSKSADPTGDIRAPGFSSPEALKRAVNKRMAMKSRVVMASGDGEVPDGDPGRGSPFANHLRTALEDGEARGYLMFNQLAGYLDTLEPTPVSGSMMTLESAGGFIFIRPPKLDLTPYPQR